MPRQGRRRQQDVRHASHARNRIMKHDRHAASQADRHQDILAASRANLGSFDHHVGAHAETR
jgi:hypothetical protein